MRILICDDDICCREQIRNLIAGYFRKDPIFLPVEVDEFQNGWDLLSDRGKKDIVFLDIEMSEADGITALRELRKQNRDVIILVVSAFSQYLDESLNFRIFRYLLKPVEKRRFLKSLEGAVSLYLRQNVPVLVETDGIVSYVESRSVIMIEARDRRTFIYTADEILETGKPLRHWEEIFPEGNFIRTHRSYLVNLDYVKKFDHETIYMEDGKHRAYLTKRKYHAFKTDFSDYLEKTKQF